MAPAPLFLWSTNTHLKYRIQQMFAGGRHYVWCSPAFEGAALPRYAVGSGQPPSSDPASIYRALLHVAKTGDQGDGKVISQKKTLKALAVSWEKSGQIDANAKSEIHAMVKLAQPVDWRPLIYVIPFSMVEARVVLVPREKRASHEPEYIVSDLSDGEFNLIEPMSCP
jgi:hypothetical protein